MQRWTLVYSDVCLTQRSSYESYSSSWSQDFCALPWNRCRFPYATQLSYIFHYCYCTFVTTLLRPFVWLFLNFSVRKNEHTAPNLHPDSDSKPDIREDANCHKVIWWKYLSNCIFPDGLLPLRLLFLDALGAAFGVALHALSSSCRKMGLFASMSIQQLRVLRDTAHLRQNAQICTSSRPAFLFLFSVFCRFVQQVSPQFLSSFGHWISCVTDFVKYGIL